MTILLDKHALNSYLYQLNPSYSVSLFQTLLVWCGGGGIGCVMWGGGVVTNETSEEHGEI